jgi:putative peptide zinc metalloprotease protein
MYKLCFLFDSITIGGKLAAMPVIPKPKLHPDVQMGLFDSAATGSNLYLLSNPHGQYWTVPESYCKFFKLFDGTRTMEALQDELDSENYGPLTGCNAVEIVDQFLRPNGLMDEEAPSLLSASGPALRATFIFPLFRSEILAPLTRLTQHAFRTSVALLVLLPGALLFLNTYYDLTAYSFDYGMPQILTWRVVLLVLLSFPLHELGHISACRRYGVSAGKIGAGLYLFLPVMYADLSSIWALSRRQRLVVNLGGIYFDFIFACILALIATATKDVQYAFAAFAVLASCLVNLNPFIKFDGYWCVSDLLGIPNLIQNSFRAGRDLFFGKKLLLWNKSHQAMLLFYLAACLVIWPFGAWAAWKLIVSAYQSLQLLLTIGICPRRLWWQLSPGDLQNILLIGFVAVFLVSFFINLTSFLLGYRVALAGRMREKRLFLEQSRSN